jgi:SAM-dependent methyltransferase
MTGVTDGNASRHVPGTAQVPGTSEETVLKQRLQLPMSDLRAFFEDLPERQDGLQPPNRGEVLRWLPAPLAPLLGASEAILEVGTGTGALMPCLRERAPTASLVSIDLAGQMLRRTRQRCPDAALVQADVHCLPFAALCFDLVVGHNSFPHARAWGGHRHPTPSPGHTSQITRWAVCISQIRQVVVQF